jgi:hypothetical protein
VSSKISRSKHMPGIAEANRTLQVWAVRTLPREFDGTRKSEADSFGSLDKFCTASLQASHVAIFYSRLWKRLSSSVTPSINRLESRRQPLLKNKKEEKEISCHMKLVRNLERSDLCSVTLSLHFQAVLNILSFFRRAVLNYVFPRS